MTYIKNQITLRKNKDLVFILNKMILKMNKKIKKKIIMKMLKKFMNNFFKTDKNKIIFKIFNNNTNY